MEKIKYIVHDIVHLKNKKMFFSFYLMSFFTFFSYDIVRPVSNSLLISNLGKDYLPYTWIAIAMVLPLLVYFYNIFISIFTYKKTFPVILFLVSFSSLFFWKFLQINPKLYSFIFYVWKDIYIVILAEQIWAIANTTYSQKDAKTMYGVLTTSGATGAMTGTFFTQAFTKSLGTINLLATGFVLHLIVLCFFLIVLKYKPTPLQIEKDYKKTSGVKEFLSSKYLIMIFCLVGLVQIVMSLTDYQLNSVVQNTFHSMDDRTKAFSNVIKYINYTSFSFQILFTAIFLRIIGIKRTQVVIPLISLVPILAFFFAPTFLFIAWSFVSLKGLDYSLFRASKEIFYIPLSEETQIKAKNIIDIFSYRVCKVISSVIILLVAKTTFDLSIAITGVIAALLIIWTFISYNITSHHFEKMEDKS